MIQVNAATAIGGMVFDNTGTTSFQNISLGAKAITLGTGGLTVNSTAGIVAFTGTGASTRISFVLSGSQTWTNNSTTNALSLTSQNNIATGGTGANNGAALTITGEGDISIASVISQNGTITKNGSGQLTLGAANTFNGTVTLNAGKLVLGNNGALGNQTLTINDGTTIDVTAARTNTKNNAMSWNGNFTFGGCNTWDTGTGAVTMNASRTVTVTASTMTVSGAIGGGAVSLTKEGAGKLTLNATNSYSGGTTVNAGTLQAKSAGSLPGYSAGTVAVNNAGSILALNVGAVGEWASAEIDSLLTNSGVTFAAGTSLGIDTTGGNFAYNTNITKANMGLTKLGTNTLTLGGTNTYTGLTTVGNGTLKLGGSSAINSGNNLTVTSPGIFDINGNDQTLGLLTNSGNVTNSGALKTLTIGAGSTGGGNFTGTMNLVWNQGATNSSITGNTQGMTGNLTLNANDAGTISFTTANHTGLIINSGLGTGTATILSVNSTVTGVIQNSATSVLSLSGANTAFTTGLTINNGTVTSGTATGFGTAAINLGDTTASNTNNAALNSTNNAGTIANEISVRAGSSGILSIRGQTNSQTFSGNISLSNDVTLAQLTAAKITTFSGNITGAYRVSIGNTGVVNAGTVVLSGLANTYSGGTTLNSGTLSLTLAAALPNYNVAGNVVFNGGTLSTLLGDGSTTGWSTGQVDALLGNATKTSGAIGIDTTNGNAVQWAAFTDAIGLTKLGTNTLTLNQANTYAGNTTISAGTLALGVNDAIASGAGKGNVSVAGTLDLAGFDQTVNGLSGAGTVINSVAGTKTLTVGSNDATSTWTGGINTGTGDIAVVKTGSGMLSISTAQSFTGGLTLNAGVIRTTGGNIPTNLGNGLLTLNGGELQFGSNAGRNYARNTTVGGDVTITSDRSGSGSGLAGFTYTLGTLSIGGQTLTVQGGPAPDNGTAGVTFGAATLTGSATLLVNNNGLGAATLLTLASINNAGFTPVITGTGNTTVSGVVTGAGGLTKNGTGTLNLNGANDFTGGVTIKNGTVSLGNAAGAGTGVITLGDSGGSANVNLTTNNAGTYANDVTVASGSTGNTISIYNTGSIAVVYSGNITLSNNLTVSANGTGSIRLGGNLTGSSVLTVASTSTANVTIGGVSNTYNGGTILNSGILKVENNTALGLGSLTINGGGLSSNGTGARTLENNIIVSNDFALGLAATGQGPLTLAGTMDLGNAMRTITVNSPGGNATIAGVISNGGLTLAGGNLTLSNANNYSGGTILNSGSLRVGNNSALGAGTLTINGGGLSSNSTGARTLENNIIVGGDFDLGLAATGTGAITLNGTVNLGGAMRGITVNNAGPDVITGVVSNGGITKNGTGTLTLNATNSYNGGTILNSGTLNIQTDNALGTGTFTINGGTIGQTSAALNPKMTNNNTIVINGDFTAGIVANGALDLGSGDVSLGSSLASNRTITVTNSGAALTIGGNITNGSGGANQIVKAGAGTLTLTGNSTVAPISGGAVIKQGILNLSFGSNTGGGDVVNAVGNGTIVLGDAGGGDARLSTGSFTIANEILLGTGAVGNLIIGSTGATRSSLYTGNVTMNGNNLTILNAGSSTNHRFTGNFLGAGSLTIMNNATGSLPQAFVMMNGTVNNGGNIIAITNCGTNGGTYINGNIGSSVVDLRAAGRGTLTLTGTNSYTGTTTINSTSTLQLGNNGATGNLPTGSLITNNGTLAFNRTNAVTQGTDFANVIAGTGAVAQIGSGTLTLNGSNTYSGGTKIVSGIVSVESTNALGTGTVTFNGTGTLALNTPHTAISSISFTGAAGNQTLGTVGGNDILLASGGSITVTNSATLTASNSTYTINAPLVIENAVGTGAGTYAINNNSENGAGAGTATLNIGGAISGSATTGNTTILTFKGNPVGPTRTVFNTISGDISDGTAGGNLDLNFGAGLTATNWVLTGTNTFTGNVTVISGGATLSVASDANLGLGSNIEVQQNSKFQTTATFATSKNLIVMGGTPEIAVAPGTTLTLNGAVSANGSAGSSQFPISVNGGGNLVLNGVGNFATNFSVVQVSAGSTLSFGNAAALTNATLRMSTSGSLDNTSGGDLALTGLTGLDIASSFTFNGTNSLDLSGAPSTSFTGTNNTVRDIAVTNNTLTIGGILTTGTGPVGQARVNGTLTKSGSGTLVIAGASDYTGNTSITAGTLKLGNAAALGTGTLSINGTATSTLDVTSDLTIANNVNANGDWTFAGSHDLTINGNFALNGNRITTVTTGNLTLAGTRTGNTDPTQLIKAGAGTLILGQAAGANMTGSTSIFGGTLRSGANDAIANSTLVVKDNLGGTAAWDINGTTNTLGNIVLGSSGSTATSVNNIIDSTGGGLVTFTGTVTYNGTNNPLGSTISANMTLGTSAKTFTVDDSSNAVNDLTVSGVLSSTTSVGRLVKDGAGTMVLSGTNTYNGTTTVNAGTLSFTSGNVSETGIQALGTSATVNLGVASTSSGTLNYTGAADTLAKDINVLGNGADTIQNSGSGLLTLSGAIAKNGTVLTIKGGGSGIDVTGSIGGASANSDLIIDGGLTTLSAANTYNGPTFIINGANLTANVTDALPTVNGRTAVSMDQTGSGSSTVTLGASQSIASLTGATTSAVNLNANNLTVGTTSGSTTFAGVISGAGSLVKDGASTQILSGVNTYTGSTTVNNGTLRYGIASAINSSSNVTVNANGLGLVATFDLNGFSGTIGTLTLGGAGATGTSSHQVTTGAGTLTLGGNVTYDSTGDSSTSAGISGNLDLGAASRTFAVANSSGAVIDLNISAIVSGTGVGLTKDGDGKLLLGAANTYEGTTTVTAGALRITNNNALGTTGNNTEVSAFAALELDGSGGDLTISETLVLNGSGISVTGALKNISGNNSYNGDITYNANNTRINSDSGTLTINGNISGSAGNLDFQFGGAGDITVNGAISTMGTGGLTKDTSGTVSLLGANTFENGTTINGGRLVINTIQNAVSGTANSLGVGNSEPLTRITMAGGTTLKYVGSASGSSDRTIILNSPSGGSYTLDASGTETFALSGLLTNSGTSGTTNLVLDGNGNGTHSAAFANGSGSNTGAITKNGTGTWTLSGASSYDGTTTVNAGMLVAAHSTALGSTANGTSVAVGATLALTGGISVGAEALTLTADASASNTILTSNSGSNTWGGDITVNTGSGTGRTILNSEAGSNLIVAGNINLSAGANDFVIRGNGDGEISGNITGSQRLFKSSVGNGTWTLSGDNSATFTGRTAIGNGVLQISSEANLGTTPGSFVANQLAVGGALTNGTLKTTANMTISANRGVALNAGGGTFDTDASTNLTVNSIISGSGNSLTKAGAGNLFLFGVNTYSGNTTINGGAVVISADSGLGTAPGSPAASKLVLNDGALATTATMTLSSNRGITLGGTQGGQMNVTTGTTLTYGGVVAGSKALEKAGAGTLVLSGTNTYSGATLVSAGALQIGDGGTAGTFGGGAVTNNATVVFNRSDSYTSSNDISGTGALTQNGSGTTILTGNLSYTGITTVNTGTLRFANAAGGNLTTGDVNINGGTFQIGASDQLASTSNVTINSGGTFEFFGNNITQTISGLTSNGTFTTGSGEGNLLVGVGGTINWNNGSNTITTNNTVSDKSWNIRGGTNIVQQGATLRVQSGGSGLQFRGTGTPSITLSSSNSTAGRILLQGNVTVESSVAGASILNGGNGTNSGFINMAGGNRTFTVGNGTASTDFLVTAILSNGTVTKEGTGTMAISGNNTYTGPTNVNEGTLLVNGNQSASTGNVTVASGATLGGNGTLGGATTVYGIVAPGNGDGDIDTLNIASNVTWMGASSNGTSTDWIFDLGAGNMSDLLNITGDFLKDDNGGTQTVFNFNFGGSTHSGTFVLVNWSGSTGFSESDFSFTNLGGGLIGSFAFNGSSLEFSAVPEPSTWVGMAALVFGAGVMFLRRRKATGTEKRLTAD